jgi:hypothetical protein
MPRHLLSLALTLGLAGCASVPPQIATTHQKQREILESLRESHLAMVDAYVDQKLLMFEGFFFDEYGTVYLKHWRANFKTLYGREYDEPRDFKALYNDLVAEYDDQSAPLQKIRMDLHAAIQAEYGNALTAHQAVGDWIGSMEALNTSQRQALDRFIQAVKPGLSLDAVDRAVATTVDMLRTKMSGLR